MNIAIKVRSESLDDLKILKSDVLECIELGLPYWKDFLKNPIDTVKIIEKEVKAANVKVSVIHMPLISKLTDDPFKIVFDIALQTCYLFGTRKIVMHPTREKMDGNLKRVIFDFILPQIVEKKLTLCWETFRGKGRFISTAKSIMDFSNGYENFKICYDFSHAFVSQAITEKEIKETIDFISVFHLSNLKLTNGKSLHQPIGMGDIRFEPMLDFLLKENKREIDLVVEYLPTYFQQQIIDAILLKRRLKL